MADDLVVRSPIAGHGEFRAYYHPARSEVVFEVLREVDGRACMLRLPHRERAVMGTILHQTLPRLADPVEPAFDEQGVAVLRRVVISPGDRLAAVVLASDEERAFAVWREEKLRAGWSWTIDVVVVPLRLAPMLAELVLQALERIERR